jgi:transcriptional regulator with XRE-family HTH domain
MILQKDDIAWFPNQGSLSLAVQVDGEARLLAGYIPHGYNPAMIIGDRLRALREDKRLSQGDIEKRTGLLRCYISRVENGHTVPAVETLEKMARALEIPIYQLFYDGDEPPVLPNLLKRKSSGENAWGSSGKDARFLSKLRRSLGKAKEADRKIILLMAQKMAVR